MRLHLVDIDPRVVVALSHAFAGVSDVDVTCADIVTVAHEALVSPANSHGFMDGGVDQAYVAFFGADVERLVRERIARRPEGFLPVGAAEIVATGHVRVPWLVVAPTMEMPEHVPAANAYRALRASLRAVARSGLAIADLYCPGLCTLVGGVAAQDAAAEMAQAYRDWRGA